LARHRSRWSGDWPGGVPACSSCIRFSEGKYLDRARWGYPRSLRLCLSKLVLKLVLNWFASEFRNSGRRGVAASPGSGSQICGQFPACSGQVCGQALCSGKYVASMWTGTL
jgi:hypothetical protein